MEEHKYKWQFAIQKNNGQSSGTIASEFGIKDYYSIQPAIIPDIETEQGGRTSTASSNPSLTDTISYWEQIQIPARERSASLVTLKGSQLIQTRREDPEYTGILDRLSSSSPIKQQGIESQPVTRQGVVPHQTVVTTDTIQTLNNSYTKGKMKNQVTRKVKSLPDIPASALVSQNHISQNHISQNHIRRDTQSANDNYELLTLPKIEHHSPSLVSMSLNSYLTTRGKQPGNTIVVIQPEKQLEQSDSSDDEYDSHDYYYHHELDEAHKRRGSNPTRVKLPYILPTIPPIKTRKLSVTKHPLRLHVDLKYGKAVEAKKAEMIPDAIQEELSREYGHVANTDVIIVRRNGNYTIHNRPKRRYTSEGLPLSNCLNSDISEDEESYAD